MRLLILFAVFFLSTLSARAEEAKKEPIIIGDVMNYTGQPAFTGPTRNGWKMALEEINEAGGVLGRPIEVISRDNRGEPGDAIQVAQDLINRHNTKLIMGGFQSNIGVALSELAKHEGFLFGSPWSGAEKLLWEDGHDLVFRIQPPPQTYGAILAKHAGTVDTWVTISPDYEGGHGFTKAFTDPLQEKNANAKLLDQYWPALDKLEAGATVQAVRRHAPQGIFTHLYGSDLVAFIREGEKRELFQGREVVTVVSGWQESYSGLGEDYPEGWWSTGYPVEAVEGFAHKTFVEEYKAKYDGALPTFGSLHGYILMKFYAAAIEKAGSTDPHAVGKAVRGLTLETPVGPITIRAVDGQSTIGMWVGKTGLVDGKPALVDFVYESGESYLPSPEEVQIMRKGK